MLFTVKRKCYLQLKTHSMHARLYLLKYIFVFYLEPLKTFYSEENNRKLRFRLTLCNVTT